MWQRLSGYVRSWIIRDKRQREPVELMTSHQFGGDKDGEIKSVLNAHERAALAQVLVEGGYIAAAVEGVYMRLFTTPEMVRYLFMDIGAELPEWFRGQYP